MQVQSITRSLTTKPLKRILARKPLVKALPFVCSAMLMHGVAANAQDKGNNYDVHKDTVEFVKNTTVPEKTKKHNKPRSFNLSERIYPSLAGEYDYMYGANTTTSMAIGGNNMLVDDKTGSFVNLFLGGGLGSPSKEGKKVSAIGILASEVFFPQTYWSIRGRAIGMLGANNLLAVDMPTPRLTMPINSNKTATVMFQPMLRYLHTKNSDSWAPGLMINSFFPWNKKQCYFELYPRYNLVTHEHEVTGFLAIPF